MNREKGSGGVYEEGHKRETRKSYQAYLEELTAPRKEDDIDDASDDSNRRRSKRTPVPKRNFKLIDDFQSEKKEQPVKKRGRKKGGGGAAETATESAPLGAPEMSTEQLQTNETMGVPEAVSEDQSSEKRLVDESIVKEETEVELIKLEVKHEEDDGASNTTVSTSVFVNPEQNNEEESIVDEEATPRKSGRVRKPKQFKDSVTPSYIKKSVERSLKGTPVAAEEESPPKSVTEKDSPKKKKRGRKPMKTKVEVPDEMEPPVLNIKHEPLSDLSQGSGMEEEVQQHTSTGRKRKRSSTSHPPKPDDASTCSEPEFSVSIKSGGKRAKVSEDDATATEEENKTSRRKSSKKESSKKDRRRSSTKLVVSFKKKPSDKKVNEKGHSDGVDQKITTAEIKSEVPEVETPVHSQQQQLLHVKEEVSSAPDPMPPHTSKPKHSKKSKKKKEKTKKKLNNKNQKVIDVNYFPVQDGNIIRVKKKKIYKKRNGTKVLVRIIKNHCNADGEIIKTETIAVDNVPVEESKQTPTTPATAEIISPSQSSLDVSIDDDEQQTLEAFRDDEEYVPPEMEKEKKKTKKYTKTKKDPPPSKEKPKKTAKSSAAAIKHTSRPANKNVTVGGKVVGKTTKGIKKTGEANMSINLPKQIVPKCTCCTGRLVKIRDQLINCSAVSEPKNAYNLFCRIYRPLIVKHHRRADFAEISRRLAHIWKLAPAEDRERYVTFYNQMSCAFKVKLSRLSRVSPYVWSEAEFKYIKKAISHNLKFSIPAYSTAHVSLIDMAAHLKLLGESLSVIGGALQKQTSMTVHGAMSVLLDSILCAIAPLLFMTSYVPKMKAISDEDQAKTLENISYILPGL